MNLDEQVYLVVFTASNYVWSPPIPRELAIHLMTRWEALRTKILKKEEGWEEAQNHLDKGTLMIEWAPDGPTNDSNKFIIWCIAINPIIGMYIRELNAESPQERIAKAVEKASNQVPPGDEWKQGGD